MRLPVCFGVWVMMGTVVLAQPSAPQPESQPSAPRATTQAYGAWLLRCRQPLEQAGSARHLCEIAQIVQDQNRQMVAQFVLGQRGGVGDWLLMVQIPVNVATAAVLNLQVEGIDPILLPLRRCVGGSCFAEVALDEPAMGRLRQTSAASRGSVEYELGSGGMAKMPFSLEGFTVAFNALSTR